MLIKDTRGRPKKCKHCGKEFKIDKETIEEWNKNKSKCPHCSHEYCDKPQTEIDLLVLQEEYIKTKDLKILNNMIKIMLVYCESLLKKFYRNYITDPSKLNYYSHTAVSFIVEDYLSKPDYKVWGSFSGILFPKIRQALWGSKEKDIDAESINFEYEDGHEVIYSDDKKSVMQSIVQRHENKVLINQLCDLIFNVKEYCESEKEDYIRILNVHNYIIGGEKWTDKYFNDAYFDDKTGKLKFIQTLSLIKNQLISNI